MPMAGRARLRLRHVVLGLSFLICVCAPLAVTAWYLYAVAKDQYASSVGFAVRTEEVGSAIELLGGITELSGSSSSDTDVLYEFIQSQNMVRAINARVDLRVAYHQPSDPVFGIPSDVRIEDVVDYWQRMVKVFYDRASGLIEIRVLAFDPDTAQEIAQAIFDESSDMINQLSAIARSDTTRYARDELNSAIERLKDARGAVTAYRIRTQIIDPVTDIQGRMGLVNSLQTQLAEALIELDLVRRTSPETDPRVVQAERRVEVIRERLAAERKRFSEGGDDESVSYSSLVSEYEGLAVEQEFAEKAYLSALAAFDTAQAEAQRKSRYLATYIDPTVAESSKFPKRMNILGILGAVLFLGWAIAVMVYYSIRDRR
ncbi:sugar transporter [Oceanicola sp. 22II-s10i]|nr:sugar transporter [Oceanicola sp. 22II-s10i]